MFERCPSDPNCEYCSGRRARPVLAGIVDAVYCINLQEQPKRFADTTALFHREGLCGDAMFYRPHRGRHSSRAIWSSHRELAREAIRLGQRRILVFEDDLRFLDSFASILDTTRRAIAKLPDGWFGLYLGHSPVQGYFVGRGVMRASSSTSHAYIANRPLIDWLVGTEPMDPYQPLRPHLVGRGLDSAFATLPKMFALFPMKIVQRRVAEARRPDRVSPAPWFDRERFRLFFIVEAMRPKQWIAAVLSPLHFVLMNLPARPQTPPREVRAEVRRLFDEAHYLSHNPDVAASGRLALEHFLAFGSREGRNPNAWFDTKWYLAKYGQARRARLTAFEHYLWRGRSLGYRANGGERSEQAPSGLPPSPVTDELHIRPRR